MQDELKGIVERVTFHNPENGWSVLRVQPFDQRLEAVPVLVHQQRVFAGATMRFLGQWSEHPRFGRQFKADTALEVKPASAAALEKYLGSGLIKGVGPKTARKIVRHFGDQTLDIFEQEIDRLTEVPGIAEAKLKSISAAWQEHRAIREVMLFLQGHGISTLFAVRIYKEYGDKAIEVVNADPYRLAEDIFGIGFFSADQVALSLGFAKDGEPRLMAAIRHVLAAGREQGHCYLTLAQVIAGVNELLELDIAPRAEGLLAQMAAAGKLMVRTLADSQGNPQTCYYSKTLYYDEETVATRIKALLAPVEVDRQRVADWLARYCQNQKMELSAEQQQAVAGVVGRRFAILTGGPGCGKTTATRVLVRLLEAMGQRVVLAAPTGRAAQRLGEVVGREARTIHRLLEWQGSGFKRRADHPLEGDFFIVDECSMLDVSLSAALLRAVPPQGQVLFIGDPDQLPPVGAGNVLRDLLNVAAVPAFRLTKVFRQAAASAIVRFAHQINRSEVPRIDSPFQHPERWQQECDCLFLDADEATREQLHFLGRVRRHFAPDHGRFREQADPFSFRLEEAVRPYESEFELPEKFRHVDLEQLLGAESRSEELKALLKKVHPWSALHYGLSAVEVVKKLYREWIPKYRGQGSAETGIEIQVLSPMTRGSLGTRNLNEVLQAEINPAGPGRPEVRLGERLFRLGDRVIHTRNNYDLEVFNGDIGVISAVDHEAQTCEVTFPPDSRRVNYRRDQLPELELAYAITIHKSQGSEFAAVIIPVLSQHYRMLFNNLIYTGLTRARRLAVLVGSRRALALAVHNRDTAQRQTALVPLLAADSP
ncbi:SF1B family DNA helicase RecD2 [Desulfurivibrio alkaliphilus]|uniref:Helicase, RecD/TraA family n=1 Tax=Desulfurivibrio alkaliphilus (strain DSM 19089 / UNIQEM U267 / AHT2) TaxID=589865 RepID=D6Z067_DESAT|nr:AAA family ATPase [Desulfurivibrio alkaliphilus]ADH87100.1 helicase, RecD/TraA family [Desulfurivibrio alkaliphilus AHT 2]